jgi:WD40 repeat protein
MKTNSTQETIDLGPPVLVHTATFPYGVISPDGKLCAVSPPDENRWRILRTDTFMEVARTGVQGRTAYGAFNPDGKLLATGSFHGPGVKVWNTQNGELVKDLPAENDNADTAATVAFSADGRHLVISTHTEYCFWEIGSWSQSRRIPQEPGSDMVASMTFSRDGRLFAGTHHRNVVRLYDAVNGQPLADLEAPNSKFVSSVAFNPDGTQLMACESSDALRVWDLRMIREKLADMGLDWQ